MIKIIMAVYAAAALVLGFLLMRKYDRFLNSLDTEYRMLQTEAEDSEEQHSEKD